jgi:hypothetical protein
MRRLPLWAASLWANDVPGSIDPENQRSSGLSPPRSGLIDPTKQLTLRWKTGTALAWGKSSAVVCLWIIKQHKLRRHIAIGFFPRES